MGKTSRRRGLLVATALGAPLWAGAAWAAQPAGPSRAEPASPTAAQTSTQTGAAASAPAGTQPTPTGATNSGDGSVLLGEVVVTSQKREERLRDVPLAVSAYAAASLQSLNINSATDLRQVSPSLNFTPSANARGEGFAIRGVGTAIFSDAVEQSVGTVVDGVPLARSGQATTDLVDLDRVEVLRGPQGLLFGKNASAGVISVITRRPVLDVLSFDGLFSYASRDEVKVQGTVNIPVGSTAALRVSVSSTTADGLIYNVRRQEDLNNRNEQLIRARFLWKPNERFSAYVIADGQWSNNRCCAWAARSAPITTAFGAQTAAQGITPSVDNLLNAAGAPFYAKAAQKGLSLELNYDLGWASLTTISAYRGWVNSDNNDPDLLPVDILDRNKGVSRLRQLTQEARIASPSGGKVEWLAGVFYAKLINSTASDQAGTLGAVPAPNILGTGVFSTTDNDSKAVFGTITLRPLPRLKLIAGARYTDETVDLNYRQYQSVGTIASIPGRYIGAIIGSASDTNFSYRFTAQYDVWSQGMVYATYAKGFKGPGINTLGVTSPIPTLIQSEIPETFELGSRFSLWRNTAVSIAAFDSTFTNFQAQVFDQTVNPGVFRVQNAGRLDTKGVEAELESRPMQGLTFAATMTYLDATYGDFRNIACYTGQPVSPFGTARTSPRQCIASGPAAGATAITFGTGNRLTNAPEFTFALRARYERPIRDYRAFIQGNYYWRDDVSFSAAGDPNLVQPSYGLLGGSIGVGPQDGKWQLSVFVKNLTDEHYATNVISQPVLNAVGVYSQFVAPDSRRVVGVQLKAAFGG